MGKEEQELTGIKCIICGKPIIFIPDWQSVHMKCVKELREKATGKKNKPEIRTETHNKSSD